MVGKGKKASAFDKAGKTEPRERKMERGIKVPPEATGPGLSLVNDADRGFVHCANRSGDSTADPGRGFHVANVGTLAGVTPRDWSGKIA